MKQHPDSINRDLDDEVAEAIEHQYARRLMKSGAADQTANIALRKRSAEGKSGDEDFDKEMEQLREKSGF